LGRWSLCLCQLEKLENEIRKITLSMREIFGHRIADILLTVIPFYELPTDDRTVLRRDRKP
jgi:hypothetical protein